MPPWIGHCRCCAASPARLRILCFRLNCRQSTGAMGSLCAACWAQVRFIERPFCERLGTPFAMDLGSEGLLSPEAVANPPVFARARAVAHPPVFARARAVAHFEDGPVRQLGQSGNWCIG
jgi:predicted amidophosphoribosyltransferase